ncbi:PREDICTED: U-box domain-containing protein 11-like [Nelumbo nucifera]|uniref:RING-type E3 ubiquitin transferase n=2 Tax=Nelumbo nucifera TaxID=4432 RepID=A0A1U8ABM1_NELNU|nr:PREDICTED: U-box domain-containing protein 11-like [Nelumbo nucifera]DAD35647.1 TPA_asm: hypothetical protein HUJ06_006287 [Nelumbo nucifera]
MAGVDVPRFGQALLDLVQDIGRIGAFGDVYKKECSDLCRRIALLSYLFEEIRDFKGIHGHFSASTSTSSSSCFNDLLVALKAAKLLLSIAANYDSGTSHDLCAKEISLRFQCITWQLDKALGNIPYDHFNVSEEVWEQVELVRSQLRRATERNGSPDSRTLCSVLSEPVDQEPDILETGEGAFENIANVDHECQEMGDIVTKGNGKIGHNIEQMIHECERPKRFLTSSQVCKLNEDDNKKPDNLDSSNSMETKKTEPVTIPDDFRCPISLELMRDPVIVATGQTYERSYIQRWIDSGHKTCPKTQQNLQNLTLTPNYVLRSLIAQWCKKNNIEHPMGSRSGRIRKSDGSFQDVNEEKEVIDTLVHKLSSRSVEDQRSAATEIRSLSKRSTNNRILIAEAGAIPLLVNLLTTEDVRTQENVVTCILNLSIYENNKELIMLAGAVPSIVQVLRMGSMEARENAAATLFSLSLADENKIIIGASGAIPALIELLSNGSLRGKKDAATALFNLCIYQGNRGRAVRAGILIPLMKMLTNSSSCVVDEVLAILSVLASHQEGKIAIAKASTIPVLIDLIRTGMPRNKENAAAILLSLCKKNDENLACIGRLGAVIPLTELAKSGTERAKRKAGSLLELLCKLKRL